MATDPAMQPVENSTAMLRSPARTIAWVKQFWLIFRLQYTDYREYALTLILFSLLMPICFQLLLGKSLTGSEGTAWFLAGNIILSVAFGSASFVLFRMGQLKLAGQLDYYATLPINKTAFVTALFLLSQVSAFPGMLVALVLGHWWLNVPGTDILLALPIALVASISLTVIGAALGAMAKDFGQLNLMNNMFYAISMFLAPVLTPVERMLPPFRILAYTLPVGQAVLALGDALVGRHGPRFWLMLSGLGFWLVLALAVGIRRLDWRKD